MPAVRPASSTRKTALLAALALGCLMTPAAAEARCVTEQGDPCPTGENHYRFTSDIGGYSCRPNTADTSQNSLHAEGRALDWMANAGNDAHRRAVGRFIPPGQRGELPSRPRDGHPGADLEPPHLDGVAAHRGLARVHRAQPPHRSHPHRHEPRRRVEAHELLALRLTRIAPGYAGHRRVGS